MEPIAVAVRKDGEWSIVHRCRKCGILRTNRIAGDDSEIILMSLAVRPLARPPFPLDRLDFARTDGKE
jgi:ribosome biogenesis GTPase